MSTSAEVGFYNYVKVQQEITARYSWLAACELFQGLPAGGPTNSCIPSLKKPGWNNLGIAATTAMIEEATGRRAFVTGKTSPKP